MQKSQNYKSRGFLSDTSYSPYSGSATKHTSDVALNGRVTAAPSAFFGMAVTSSDFHSGNATQNNPYQGYTNTDYQINAVYINNSMVTANSFTTNPISNTNFSLTSHGCNGNQGAMAHNATCTDRYTLNTNNAGDYNLDLTNTTASWADSSGTYTNVPISGAKIYTRIILPLIVITGVTDQVGGIIMGNSIQFVATINGGNAAVTAAFNNPMYGRILSEPTSCFLSENVNHSCIFTAVTIWDTLLINSSNLADFITVSSEMATVDKTQLYYTLQSPTVYLPAISPNGNTGINWDSTSRFSTGYGPENISCTPAENTILDTLTNLMWTSNPSRLCAGNACTWSQAQLVQ